MAQKREARICPTRSRWVGPSNALIADVCTGPFVSLFPLENYLVVWKEVYFQGVGWGGATPPLDATQSTQSWTSPLCREEHILPNLAGEYKGHL